MEYLGDGDFTPHGGASDNFSNGLPYTTAANVSAGFFQFSPNPYDEGIGDLPQVSLANSVGVVNGRGSTFYF